MGDVSRMRGRRIKATNIPWPTGYSCNEGVFRAQENREALVDIQESIDQVDMVMHSHNVGHPTQEYAHMHDWGSVRHGHFARAVCNRPESAGCGNTHNIHPDGQ